MTDSAAAKARKIMRKNARDAVHREPEQSNINRAKRVMMARTGMTPLDFLVSVYRDELYTDYNRWLAEDGKTYFYVPDGRAQRIRPTMEQRIAAARASAPYLHKKMPIGIEDSRGSLATIPVEKLRELSDTELDVVLRVMHKIGVSLPVEVGAQQGSAAGAIAEAAEIEDGEYVEVEE